MNAVLPDAPVITSKKLLEVGPILVKPAYGTQRNLYLLAKGVHIIDLDKTIVKVEEAYAALKDIVTRGGKVLLLAPVNNMPIIKAPKEVVASISTIVG